MPVITCHVPLTVKLSGEPREEDWTALEEVLVARYTHAIARGLEEVTRSHPPVMDAIGVVRESFPPARLGSHRYQIPTYEDAGQTQVPLAQVTPARSPEEVADLISSHTRWGNLDEDELGTALFGYASQGDHALVQQVFDALSLTNRDDVAVALVSSADDLALSRVAESEGGRRLLDRLFDEITSGSVGDDEKVQADRIMIVKSRLITPEQFARGTQNAKIFPYRLPGLTVLNAAPIFADRRGGGKVWVKLLVNAVLGSSEYREETKTLPTEVFTSGIELPEDEIVGVRMYDLGGEVVYRPALYLVQLANETTTTTYQKMGEVAALGLSLGTGTAAMAVGRVTFAARALIWADRAVATLGTLATIIDEHRGWIIQHYGASGRRFLTAFAQIQSAVAIYGIARTVLAAGQLLNSLRVSYRDWRAAATKTEAALDARERDTVQQIATETEDLLQQTDEIKAAQGGSPAVSEAPSVQQPAVAGTPVEGPAVTVGPPPGDEIRAGSVSPAAATGPEPPAGLPAPAQPGLAPVAPRRGEPRTVIRSVVGDPQQRADFENQFFRGSEYGLEGFERAHSQGAGIGAESPEGILLAPREVNQELQNRGIEAFIRELQASKPPDIELHLTTETFRHSGTMRLREITYRLEAVQAGGARELVLEAWIAVENARVNPRVTFGVDQIGRLAEDLF